MNVYTPEAATAGSLAYEIAELGWMAEALENLIEAIAQSSYALPDDIPRRALGPIDSAHWLTGVLAGKVRSLRAAAQQTS